MEIKFDTETTFSGETLRPDDVLLFRGVRNRNAERERESVVVGGLKTLSTLRVVLYTQEWFIR